MEPQIGKKAYWVAQMTITRPEAYKVYAELASAVFARYGGRILARGGEVQALEGAARERNVIIEFASMEDARACYFSAEYQAARQNRDGACVGQLMLLQGV